ncbi:endonuclease/exonuclease/phosphatase family metal-dependent hydrolase [Motilibacter peucedani]|uniref:Endonuclease/exonuclease/phosphatase family metal-dependent hydrolase n=1 Tax=Motilibacter peucedani TaxID=598650 RepID=A0A420XPE2_9ACTN|nr:endonuclease/exonuclease/phosphatase family protein [Motilibacter peucedani]RKS74063.1 endonuclease/exonuclease/phosphatase family metal-dependent hydrolase [Motilibacter peucedani]
MLRVLSYNIRSLRDDRAALARVVRACAPDLVCVQEAPRFVLSRWQLRRLAAATGLRHVCGGRATHGPVVLAHPAVEVLARREVALPRTRGLHARGLALATVRVGGQELAVGSLHLGLRPDERLRNVAGIEAALDGVPRESLLLAGDLNEPPGGPAWHALAALGLRDAYAVAPRGPEPTFSSANPRRRIDAVLVGGAFTVHGCGVAAELPGVRGGDLARATDHLPVLAELHIVPR